MKYNTVDPLIVTRLNVRYVILVLRSQPQVLEFSFCRLCSNSKKQLSRNVNWLGWIQDFSREGAGGW